MEFRRPERKSRATRLSVIWDALGSLYIARDAETHDRPQCFRPLFSMCFRPIFIGPQAF